MASVIADHPPQELAAELGALLRVDWRTGRPVTWASYDVWKAAAGAASGPASRTGPAGGSSLVPRSPATGMDGPA